MNRVGPLVLEVAKPNIWLSVLGCLVSDGQISGGWISRSRISGPWISRPTKVSTCIRGTGVSDKNIHCQVLGWFHMNLAKSLSNQHHLYLSS